MLVLVGAERVERVAVGAVDRRAGQPEQERVRQRLAHLAAEVALLGAVGLVDHGDDVVAVVEDARRLAELVDRRDDDLAHVLRQQPLQLLAAVGLDQVRHVGGVEGARDLGVEVDAVDHDQHGRVPERRMQPQLARREHHQQRLARALEVPDQALLRVAGHDALDDLVRRLVLLVAGDDLDPALLLVGGEGGEVARAGRARRCGRSIDVDRLLEPAAAPAVSAVGLDAPRPPELDRQPDRAVAELLALGGEREDVGHEELRHVLLVVVVHLERAVEPALARADGRLRLDHDQRDAVDQQHEVGPLLGRARRGR